MRCWATAKKRTCALFAGDGLERGVGLLCGPVLRIVAVALSGRLRLFEVAMPDCRLVSGCRGAEGEVRETRERCGPTAMLLLCFALDRPKGHRCLAGLLRLISLVSPSLRPCVSALLLPLLSPPLSLEAVALAGSFG